MANSVVFAVCSAPRASCRSRFARPGLPLPATFFVVSWQRRVGRNDRRCRPTASHHQHPDPDPVYWPRRSRGDRLHLLMAVYVRLLAQPLRRRFAFVQLPRSTNIAIVVPVLTTTSPLNLEEGRILPRFLYS